MKEVVFEENSSLKRVGEDAFNNCSDLKNISLPEGLESLGKGCFAYSGLEEIIIPSSVTAIEHGAFSNCGGLKKVTFHEDSRLQRIGSLCFCDCGLE